MTAEDESGEMGDGARETEEREPEKQVGDTGGGRGEGDGDGAGEADDERDRVATKRPRGEGWTARRPAELSVITEIETIPGMEFGESAEDKEANDRREEEHKQKGRRLRWLELVGMDELATRPWVKGEYPTLEWKLNKMGMNKYFLYAKIVFMEGLTCLLYTSPSPRDRG